jgi:hypothetical protein
VLIAKALCRLVGRTAPMAALFLAGCFESAEPPVSVPDYWRDPERMAIDVGWCSAHPGERHDLPKCVNARKTLDLWSINDDLLRCHQYGKVNQTCVEAFIAHRRME